MPDNKRQHFVPQFYLRYFSDAEARAIGVFNIARAQYIPAASLKKQAYRNWFYGKNLSVEHGLRSIEGVAASILGGIVHRDRLPSRYSRDHHAILTFVALQITRTAAAAAIANEQVDKLGKRLLGHHLKDPELLRYLPDLRITLTHPVSEPMRASILAVPILYDLRYKVIQNASGHAFIASDAPVALHNQMFELSNFAASGFANVGLQLLMPLGPWRALLFHDEAAYDVGARTSNLVSLRNPAHARLINDLQWEVAHENLYLSPKTNLSDILEGAQRWGQLRQPQRVEVDDQILQRDGQRKQVLLTLSGRPSIVRLGLPFVRRLLPEPSSVDETKELPVRNPEWADFVLQSGRALQAQQITYEQFSALTSRFPIASPGSRRRTRR